MLLILGIPLVAAFALFAASLLRLTGKAAYALALYLLAWANIVLVGMVTGLLGILSPGATLGADVLLAAGVFLLWRRAGKPALLGPFTGWAFWREIPPLRRAPVLWLFGIGTTILYIASAGTILATPPNNYDSMTYHLARVAYWMQHGSILPWVTANLRQTTFPINSELGVLWAIQLGGSDHFAGFVQWLAVPCSMIAILGLARLLGATKQQGIFAALLWATLPQIVLQSSSTQNDLVAAAFFAIVVYFLMLGLQPGNRRLLVLAGLSLGIALGVKDTVPMMVPGLAIWLVLLWIKYGKAGFRKLFLFGMASLAGFAVFGALIYAQNLATYQRLGPVDPPFRGYEVTPYSSSNNLVGVSAMYLYQAVDFSGLPPALANPLVQVKNRVSQAIFRHLGVPIQTALSYAKLTPSALYDMQPLSSEDTAWFGLLSVFILLPATVYQLYLGLRRKDLLRIGLVLLMVAFTITLSYMITWSPYKGRYFVQPVTLLAPLAAFVYRPVRWRAWLLGLVALAGLFIGGWTLLNDVNRPLVGPNAIWGKDEIALRTQAYPPIEGAMRMVEQYVPANATLGIKLGTDGWDYAFFGPSFQRKIVQVDPYYSNSGAASLGGLQFDYLLVAPKLRTFLDPPNGMTLIAEADKYLLFGRTPVANAPHPALPGPGSPSDLIEVKPPLAGTVNVLETWSGNNEWDVEQYGGDAFYWLGEGEREELGFSVWSASDVKATFVFDVTPGPGRTDTQRTVGLTTFTPDMWRTTTRQSFDAPTLLKYEVELRPGYNEFRFTDYDTATIRVQPNGDPRPLLALLNHLTIQPAGSP